MFLNRCFDGISQTFDCESFSLVPKIGTNILIPILFYLCAEEYLANTARAQPFVLRVKIYILFWFQRFSLKPKDATFGPLSPPRARIHRVAGTLHAGALTRGGAERCSSALL